jgi:hypothetical protein
VLDTVPKGYPYYISGQCPVEKAKQLAAKFHIKYGIGCSPAQRMTRKRQGLANALLVMYWPGFQASEQEADSATEQAPERAPEQEAVQEAGAASVEWLLLVTAGYGPVHDEEKLCSVLDAGARLLWLGYELVRQPKRGRASWTWRRPKAAMVEWYALLGSQLASRKADAVANTLRLLSRQPGFSGVRQQSWALMQFARSRGYTGEVPFLFHLQKLASGVPMRLS